MARHHVMLPGERRRRDLAAIHAGAKQLKLDEDTRRDLIERITGHRSAADLDDAARAAVLRELRRLGATRPGAHKPAQYPGTPHNMHRLGGEIAKIEAQLADMKLPWSYADAIARRMFGIQRCAWLRERKQLVAVLAALDNEQLKRGLGEGINRMQQQLGITDDDIRAPKNWRRSIPALKAVYERLDAQIQAQEAQQEITP